MNIPNFSPEILLRKYRVRADKGLGQNFLHDPTALTDIIHSAEITRSDTILEIGPGLGSLTHFLANTAKKVVSVELDHDLVRVMEHEMADYSNVKIIEGDILRFQPNELMGGEEYMVVANVPYYITSAIFRHLLAKPPRPRRIVMTIQKEVAERICAKPGDMSLLTLSIQVFGKPVITHIIPAEAFHPIPKVDSAIIRIDIFSEPAIQTELLPTFFHLAKAGFSQKRKTLRNSLSAGLRMTPEDTVKLLEKSDINPMRRAESLSIEDWAKLTSNYESDKE